MDFLIELLLYSSNFLSFSWYLLMITITQKLVDDMISHSREENPNECCGILSGLDEQVSKIYRIKNLTPSPYRYVMDPKEQMVAERDSDSLGLSFIAFYHSHTHTPAYPSDTDVRMAQESGWLDFYYVLVSLENDENPVVNFFWVDFDANVSQVEYQIV